MRRNITLALALIITMMGGGRYVAHSDDLHGQLKDNTSNQVAGTPAPSPVSPSSNPSSETYRGFFLDLTEITDRQDFAKVVDALHRQVDIVDRVGLSQHVLQSFHTVPISVDEFACLGIEVTPEPEREKPVTAGACYVPRIPGRLANNEDISNGVVMVRPATLSSNMGAEGPIVLHELLHFYHRHMFPQGVEEPAVHFYYSAAKGLYNKADSYLLNNEKEFFAVTASIFLYGNDDQHEPFTRSALKEKQPEYYNYLVWLFGFDPGKRIASSD